MNSARYRETGVDPSLAYGVPYIMPTQEFMFRISITETRSERRLVVEGKLVEPWVAELRKEWQRASGGLDERKLVIDLANVTVISAEGENEISRLMNEGAKFSCNGVLTTFLVKRIARKCHSKRCSSTKPAQSND